MIRILSDENVHADIVSGLQREGFDLVTAVEVGLAGRKDIEILDYAEKQDLVLLLRYQNLNVGKMVEDIARVLRSESENLSQYTSFVIVLSERGYRVRKPSP